MSEALAGAVLRASPAGSILYVVIELLDGLPALRACRCSSRWMILLGILLGFATDFVVTAAGV